MKKGELVKKILLAASVGVTIGAVMIVPPLAIPLKAVIEVLEKRGDRIPKKKVKRVLYNLEKRRLISLREVDGDLWATFNEGGRKLLLEYKLDELKIEIPQKWDGRWWIVIFDIPEKKKLARDILREKLKSLGFYQLQRSVFIYPFACQREIELIRQVYEIEPYVYLVRADYIDNQERIKKEFNL